MVDLILLVEGTWVWLWVQSKSAERALLYIASIWTSFFVATQVTPWFTSRFVTSGHTFMWLVDQMNQSTHPVGVAAEVIPPIPTAIGLTGKSQWIATHVLQGVLTVLVTAAIFTLFVVIEYLMTAIWDDEAASQKVSDTIISQMCGAMSGTATIVASIWILANLSWLRSLHAIAKSANQSVLLWAFHQGWQLLVGWKL